MLCARSHGELKMSSMLVGLLTHDMKAVGQVEPTTCVIFLVHGKGQPGSLTFCMCQQGLAYSLTLVCRDYKNRSEAVFMQGVESYKLSFAFIDKRL